MPPPETRHGPCGVVPPSGCPSDDVSIRPAAGGDLDRIVAIHAAAFPGFFLTSLGPGFLRAYYREVLDFHGGCLLVAERGGRAIGFVAGFAAPRQFYAGLSRRPLAFALPLLAAVLRRPSLIGHILVRVRNVLDRSDRRRTDPTTEAACELSSLAVDPRTRRRGVGRRLVAAFVADAAASGLDVVRLATDARENDAVNAFYAGLGFRLARRGGPADARPMNGYELTLRSTGLRHAG